MQQWFGLSDRTMEEAMYDVPLYREFADSGANKPYGRDFRYRTETSSRRRCGLPACGRSGIFEAELREAELTIANTVYQFDT